MNKASAREEMNNGLGWLDNIRRESLIEWWAVLNCRETPTDLPIGYDADRVFEILNRWITKSERLAFWNGDFERGLKLRKFIRPKTGSG